MEHLLYTLNKILKGIATISCGITTCTFYPVEFTVVIPSYNNQRWYKQNLDSVINQTYPYFNVIYINDCSTDQTKNLVDAYVQQSPLKRRINVIHNTKRVGALKNIYDAIYTCPDYKVIVAVDGDDMLYNAQVLAKVAQEYADGKTWLTYGQFINSSNGTLGGAAAYPQEIIKRRAFRKVSWRATHLRTFHAKLFKMIKREDLVYPNGQFFQAGWDLAIMFPMLEMASKGHFKFISQILYIYNNQNPLNDSKVNVETQINVGNHICTQQPYKPLATLLK